ncbi:MAG: 2-phospho-L-lactate transferase [Deltaproteobacteria bacterium]|nr:2-phospho-L-lactate transferase [Deltaproteobacteria bacterium]MBW2585740.1 2-phospho-L-lactate transferase [Deltaproteobacteria bacterium]
MTAPPQDDLSVVALAGGVGGARLVDGLDRTLPPDALTVVVNTGDDFRHWGLHISPDLDTVMYTLAGLSPEDRGWGIDGDTFYALAEAKRRGVDDWFQLGDRDLITHLSRTGALSRGESLTRATAELCKTLGVERPVLPMSDAPRPTSIVTQGGEELVFQEWLVKARAAPPVREVRHQGTDHTTQAVLAALTTADLVVICPSNPYVSIDPILTLSGVSDALRNTTTVAVSPILDGKAVKGPLATMIAEIAGREPSAEAAAMHYEGLLDGYAVHPGDAFDAPFPLLETNILIQSKEDRVVFARELIEFARSLR